METEIVIVLLFGLFTGFGVYTLRRAAHLQQKGLRTTGIVIENEYSRSTNDDDAGAYYPVVRFQTDKQEWKAKRLDIGYNSPIPIGHKIDIIYDPDDLSNISEDSRLMLVVLPRVLLGIGLVAAILEVLVLLDVISL